MTAATADDCIHLTVDIVKEIHKAVIDEFGGLRGVRDEGLLASAVGAPQASFGGTGVFAVPQDTGPMALFVRSDIFQQHGLPVPKTWDEYAADAQKLHDADPNLSITFFDPNNAEWFNGLLWQNSAQMYGYSGDKWHVTVESAQSKQVATKAQQDLAAAQQDATAGREG